MKQIGKSDLRLMAEMLRRHGRKGDTVLAHISPGEARLLDRVTDGGSVNPRTGLPEFADESSTDNSAAGGTTSAESAAEAAGMGGMDWGGGGDYSGGLPGLNDGGYVGLDRGGYGLGSIDPGTIGVDQYGNVTTSSDRDAWGAASAGSSMDPSRDPATAHGYGLANFVATQINDRFMDPRTAKVAGPNTVGVSYGLSIPGMVAGSAFGPVVGYGVGKLAGDFGKFNVDLGEMDVTGYAPTKGAMDTVTDPARGFETSPSYGGSEAVFDPAAAITELEPPEDDPTTSLTEDINPLVDAVYNARSNPADYRRHYDALMAGLLRQGASGAQ